MHAGEHELRHPPQGRDEGVVMLQQLADDGRNRVVRCRRADRLQIAAGTEGSAFAFDDQHANVLRGFDLGAERFELLRDRQIDRVERGRPVQRDRCNRSVDPEQCGVIRQGFGGRCCRHGKSQA
jgi:hypothetical protein